ncbi:hypothetical protein IUZ65_023155 [Vibrio sp. VB16]|nr:hypothetical protein [Vibrio sp. VB16]UGA57809.1 hypothetical protein IUZ65_023155 [Vibrio sp. VB16]
MEAPLDMAIGTKFKTNRHGYATVLYYYNCYTVIVGFENTSNIRSISSTKLRSGQFVDRLVPPKSIIIGEKIQSIKYGVLTIRAIESENIVVLTNSDNKEIRLLLPSVQKMRAKGTDIEIQTGEGAMLTPLIQFIKSNKNGDRK